MQPAIRVHVERRSAKRQIHISLFLVTQRDRLKRKNGFGSNSTRARNAQNSISIVTMEIGLVSLSMMLLTFPSLCSTSVKDRGTWNLLRDKRYLVYPNPGGSETRIQVHGFVTPHRDTKGNISIRFSNRGNFFGREILTNSCYVFFIHYTFVWSKLS